jgi:hypothetical protein
MVPKRLKPSVPFAAGNNNLIVWAAGGGPFVDGPVAPKLNLRVDPEDPLHGFVEPDAIMPAEEYECALAATQPLWAVAED